MFLAFALLTLGLILVIKGADLLVDGATFLAKRFNISELAVGLTIVAFGTSAPELVVNSFASYKGHYDIVFSNVIGSNNFNLFIVLGIAGLIYPLRVQHSTVWKEIPISFFAIICIFILSNSFISNNQILSRLDGIILIILFFAFLYYVYLQLKSKPEDINNNIIEVSNKAVWKIVLLIISGLIGLILGGKLVVDNAITLAEIFGMSQKLIGLTIVAIGTSLPELATSVVAAVKKNNDIAVGNIIGSNIFNLFLILGVSSLINPIEYNLTFNTDLYVLAGGTILLFAYMFTGKKVKLDRWEAIMLLAIYISYTIWIIQAELQNPDISIASIC